MKCLGAVMVVVLGTVASPRSAEACHTLSELPVWMYGAVAIPVNGGFTVVNLIVDEPRRGYALAETLVTAPIALLGVAAARYAYSECDEGGSLYPVAGRGARIFTLGMVGWSTALFAHGIYVLVRPRSKPSAAPALVPVPISSEGGELIGFGISGRF
ncbi:MAG: hypothetical protein H0T42_03635 [Deltaproteobacteria bacterium]|nr:hypothetical protein [Deltaproteobacteria bacterium]